MDIPYTVEERPDTGLSNGKMGVWLFLASEVMLFGALFSTYVFMRVLAPEYDAEIKGGYEAQKSVWPLVPGEKGLNIPLAMLNTGFLITSSVTMVMSWASLKMKNLRAGMIYLGLTLLLSVGFLVIKAIEYGTKFSHHIYPSTSNFYAIYYTMTGLHGIHVIGGMVVMLYLIGPGRKMWRTKPDQYTNRIEITGLYWHFVDLVWIFLFPVFYLL